MSDDPTYPRLKEVLQAERHELLRRRDVNAVCISYKTVGGQKTNKLSITISVSKKKSENELSGEQLLPKELQGCITDIVEMEVVEPKGFQYLKDDTLEDVTQLEAELLKIDITTLTGGDSIGPRTGETTGTLGYFFKNSSNLRGVITSAHVVPKKGNIMVVPSVPHGGDPQKDNIGKANIKVITQHTDGAFVQLDDQTTSFTYKLKNGVIVSGVDQAKLKDKVMFYGAETGGVVSGEVVALHWSGKFPSGYTFVDQIQIATTKGIAGDSGSLLVRTSDNKALGVLMATLMDPATKNVTGSVHNNILYFQKDLGITLV